VGEAVSNLDYKRDYQFENKRMKFSVSAQGLSKGILQQELKIKANDEKIVFLVTHLKAQPGGFESDLKRIAQAHTVRMKVEEILQSNKKLVLMGDFNDVNPSPVIEQITGESKYLYDYDGSDTWLLFDLLVDYPRKDNFTYVSKRFLSAGGRRRYMGTQYCRLDYIFTTGVLKGGMRNGYIDSSIDMTDPLNSDHYPVCIEYHYRTASESVSEVSTPVVTE
jgi:endonuclease/exonuclease/phosphatase family metal-dependent hydrolase